MKDVIISIGSNAVGNPIFFLSRTLVTSWLSHLSYAYLLLIFACSFVLVVCIQCIMLASFEGTLATITETSRRTVSLSTIWTTHACGYSGPSHVRSSRQSLTGKISPIIDDSIPAFPNNIPKPTSGGYYPSASDLNITIFYVKDEFPAMIAWCHSKILAWKAKNKCGVLKICSFLFGFGDERNSSLKEFPVTPLCRCIGGPLGLVATSRNQQSSQNCSCYFVSLVFCHIFLTWQRTKDRAFVKFTQAKLYRWRYVLGCKWNTTFWVVPVENFQDQRDMWMGSPVFFFQMEMSQTELYFSFFQSHLWYQFQAFADVFR